MEPLGEHPVTAGPLSVRWLAVDVAPPRAGAVSLVRVAVENAGLATWTPQPGDRGVKASYHWLDPLGNALLWDGARTELPHAVPPAAASRSTSPCAPRCRPAATGSHSTWWTS